MGVYLAYLRSPCVAPIFVVVTGCSLLPVMGCAPDSSTFAGHNIHSLFLIGMGSGGEV